MDELMSLLTKQALTSNTVNEIARNSNTTKEETRDVVSSALPLLLSALTSNSGSTNKKDDLSSLFSQINVTSAQIEEKEEQSEQEKKETEKVGNSILDAILGSTQTGILGQIASATGITGDKVKNILVFAAPLLLKKLGSLLSTNTASTSSTASTNNKKDDNDMLSTLLGAALGGNTSSNNNKKDDNNLLTSLLGAALGGNNTSSNNNNKKYDNDLLSTLASAALSGLVNNGKK